MKSFIEKADLRAIAIFKLLFDENRVWTIDELSARVNCSNDSAYAAIQNLVSLSVTDFPNFEILIQRSIGISLITKPGCSYRIIRGVYLENSLAFKIINQLFQSSNVTIDSLASEFFVSKSTIYRNIKKIEGILGECNIEFNTSKLVFSADELLIREFFYYLYMQISRNNSWPFYGVPKELLEQRLNLIRNQVHIPLSPADEAKWLFRLGVNFVRQKQKYYITSVNKTLIDPHRRSLYQPILKEFVTSLPSKRQQAELDSLLLILSSYPILFSTDITNEMIIEWHKNENTTAYQLATDLLRGIADRYYTIPFVTTPNTLFLLICVATYAIVDKDLLLADPAGKEEYTGMLMSHPELMTTLDQIIATADFPGKYSLSERNNPYLVYSTFTILSLEYDTKIFENTVLVRILSSVHSGYELPLKNQLLAKTLRHIIVHTNIDQPAKDTLYDLVISDYAPNPTSHVYFKEKERYVWEYPPSERNWQDVLELIEHASQKNRLD